MASLLLRQRPSETSAETYRAKTLTVYSPVIIPLQLDGGVIDQDKVEAEGVVYEFTVIPRAITVLVPRTYDGALLESDSLRRSEESLSGKKRKGKRKKGKKG